jgi:hypothetical protein
MKTKRLEELGGITIGAMIGVALIGAVLMIWNW